MNYDFIIIPLVGAVIGYTTNWLAIKMLFRPYTSKYFFNIKLPFTPGIVPKERERIATSLGAAVSKNLLNKETLISELEGERVLSGLETYLDNLASKELIVDDLLKYLNFDKDMIYHKITETIINSLKETVNNQALKTRLIESLLKDKKIKNRLPKNSFKTFDEVIVNNQDQINSFILDGFANEKVQKKLYEVINSFIDYKLKILKAFIKVDTIYKAINEAVNEYIKNNPDAVISMIQDYVNNLSEKSIKEVINQSQIDDLANEIILLINNNINKQVIYDSVYSTIKNLTTKNISFNPTTFAIFKASIKKLYINFIDTQASILIEKLNINSIVESKINSFSISEMEELIVGLMKKELNSITLLGALLGFIMGLITLAF